MKRLTLETKKTIATLLVKTSFKRILDEKKAKQTCDECRQRILTYSAKNVS
ncbi:hypothetical protein [Neobacillus sp. NPDC093127]|uniref:hypothetical protein n=1 Tax=Neobacillus sp. NPDC093127 TaxID=3364296 RepID=UPI00382B9A1B